MRKMFTAVLTTVGAATWWAGGPAAGHDGEHGPTLAAPGSPGPAFVMPEQHESVPYHAPAEFGQHGAAGQWSEQRPFAEERHFAHGGYTEYRHSESHVEGYYGTRYVPRGPVPHVPHGCRRPVHPGYGYGYDVHVEHRHYRPRTDWGHGMYGCRRPGYGHGYGRWDDCAPRPGCRRGILGLDVRLGF